MWIVAYCSDQWGIVEAVGPFVSESDAVNWVTVQKIKDKQYDYYFPHYVRKPTEQEGD